MGKKSRVLVLNGDRQGGKKRKILRGGRSKINPTNKAKYFKIFNARDNERKDERREELAKW